MKITNTFDKIYYNIINETYERRQAYDILKSLNGDYEKILELPEIEQADLACLMNLPQEAIDILITIPSTRVKWELSERDLYPTEQTIKMFEDKNENKLVRQHLALSKKLPLELILKHLNNPAEDEESRLIDSYLPRNANVPLEELEKLVDNPDPNVRNSILSNPNCTAKIVEKLTYDKNNHVRNSALYTWWNRKKTRR